MVALARDEVESDELLGRRTKQGLRQRVELGNACLDSCQDGEDLMGLKGGICALWVVPVNERAEDGVSIQPDCVFVV